MEQKELVNKNSNLRQGLSGIFTPITTPFKENEDVYHEKLEENIKKYNKTAIKGYVILGSNGEYSSLSKDEKIKVLETAIKSIDKSKIIIAGTGHESTRETIELTNIAGSLGAEYALVVTPHYFKNQINREVLMYHFKSAADKTTIPILIYNVPQFTGVSIPPEVVSELSEHPNIVGMKDSSGNFPLLCTYISESSENFYVLAGSASFLLPALSVGAIGGILALANVFPDECANLLKLYNENKLKEANKLQLALVKPNNLLTVRYGVSGLKYAMDLKGYFGGNVRAPLLPLKESEKTEIKKVVEINLFSFK